MWDKVRTVSGSDGVLCRGVEQSVPICSSPSETDIQFCDDPGDSFASLISPHAILFVAVGDKITRKLYGQRTDEY